MLYVNFFFKGLQVWHFSRKKNILLSKSPILGKTVKKRERIMNKKLTLATALVAGSAAFAGLNDGVFDTWLGADGSAQVLTGLDNGSETSGYWFSYGDDGDGGASRVEWKVAPGNDYSADALDPVIEACGGVCGTAILDKGKLTYQPFVGIGFNVVGETSTEDKTPAAGDATAWGGVCIGYSSTLAAVLELGLGDVTDKALEYDNPVAKLPKSTDGTMKELSWEDFAQAGWGKGDKITGPEAAAKLVAIKFKVQAKDGTEGDFNIFSVGAKEGTPKCSSTPSGGSGAAIKAFRAASSVKAMVADHKISFSGISSDASVEIINLQGRVVKKGMVRGASALDLSAVDAGVYMVRVSGKSVDFSSKIVLK
jgi:hypothetical protein